MKRFILTFVLLTIISIIQNQIAAQPWTSLGPDDAQPPITASNTYYSTALSNNDNTLYIAFVDNSNNDDVIRVLKYNKISNLWEPSGASGGLVSAPFSYYPSITVVNNTPYVAYADAAAGIFGQLTVKRLNGTSWEIVSGQSISDDAVTHTSIAADGNNSIYVGYKDAALDGDFNPENKITVKQFDLSNEAAGWQPVGPPRFSERLADTRLSLKVDNGIPYIAYAETILTTGGVFVARFDGTNWITVGNNNPPFHLNAYSPSLVFDNNNNPYVGYVTLDQNTGSLYKGMVASLNANNWVIAGGGPVDSATSGNFENVSLACINNTIFATYVNQDANHNLIVKRIDENDVWQPVGDQPISNISNIWATSLETNSVTNELYVSYGEINAQGIYAKSFDASTLLPVTLVAFTVSKQTNTSLVEWSTITETNNTAFIVEYSTDGNNFKPVATITGKGNSSIENKYSYKHLQPSKGINYYRLTQVDKDGKATVLGMRTLKFESNEAIASVTVSPNPTTAILKIQHNLENVKQLRIRDAKGNIVLQQNTNTDQPLVEVNLSKLTAGIYIVEIYYADSITVQKFIKQ